MTAALAHTPDQAISTSDLIEQVRNVIVAITLSAQRFAATSNGRISTDELSAQALLARLAPDLVSAATRRTGTHGPIGAHQRLAQAIPSNAMLAGPVRWVLLATPTAAPHPHAITIIEDLYARGQLAPLPPLDVLRAVAAANSPPPVSPTAVTEPPPSTPAGAPPTASDADPHHTTLLPTPANAPPAAPIPTAANDTPADPGQAAPTPPPAITIPNPSPAAQPVTPTILATAIPPTANTGQDPAAAHPVPPVTAAPAATPAANAARRPASTAPAPDHSDPTRIPAVETFPTGRIVWRSARDVLASKGMTPGNVFHFDVPTFEWDGPHPLVPTWDPTYRLDLNATLGMMLSLASNKPVWAYGPQGTGKTSHYLQIGALLQWPTETINLDGHMLRSDLVGYPRLSSDNGASVSVYIDGLLTKRLPYPCLCVFDEISVGEPDLMYVVQRVFEGRGLLLLDDDGRHIAPHPYFRAAAACNTRGQGTAEDIAFPGTKQQSAAMRDRFGTWIRMGYMATADEIAVLRARHPTLPDVEARNIVTLADKIRTAYLQRELSDTMSSRMTQAVAEHYVRLSPNTPPSNAISIALALSVYNKYSDTDRRAIVQFVDAIWPNLSPPMFG